MKTLLKIVCESAFHNRENGNLNIIGAFEAVSAKNFPVTHPKMTIAQIVSGKGGEEFDFSYEIIDPSGKALVSLKASPAHATMSPNGKHHLLHNIALLPLERPGKHVIKLYAGDSVEELDFDVIQIA